MQCNLLIIRARPSASVWMCLLASVSSLSPIAWATVLVSDGNEKDVVLPHAIDDAIGKPRNNPLAVPTGQGCAGLGTGRDPSCRLLRRCQEPETEAVEACFIELHGLAHFRPGFRVEYRLLHGYSLVRNSAKTCCAGIPWTAPSRSSWKRCSASAIQSFSISSGDSAVSSRLASSCRASRARSSAGRPRASASISARECAIWSSSFLPRAAR